MAGNILLIVNEANHLRILAQVLQDAKYTISVARRAIEGIDTARTLKPALIITELNLGNMNARELTTTLRTTPDFAQTPIITIVATSNTREREMCIAAGINGFLDDPLNEQAIPLQIQFFLSGGRDTIEDQGRIDQAKEQLLQDVVKRLESRLRELEETNATLERLDEMKDTFIQLAAHELRTPLTLITGYSRLLEDHPPLKRLMQNDNEISSLIQGLSKSIGRMQTIIEDILTVSRIMTKKMELNASAFNLGLLVKRVLNTYSEAFRERRLRLQFNEAEFPVALRGDEGLLQQMFANLISNAIKYTPDGGTIFIQAETNNNIVRFSVRDTGIGIDPSMHEKIFQRMQIGGAINAHTTSKTTFLGGGLGLGLAICRGIIEAHGGKIWVESRAYDPVTCPGSEFIVVIPIVSSPTTQPLTRIKRLPVREN